VVVGETVDSQAPSGGSKNEELSAELSQESEDISSQPVLDLSSQFLPSSLPEGDPAHFALPVFLEEPEDTYVVKGRAASLQCKVLHALSLHVQCNDEVQSAATVQEREESGVGPYTQATLLVTRDQVEEFFGDYHCACVAYSSKGRTSSRLARVAISFLKKQFEVPPYSEQGLVGRQVELRCHPPKGKPEPQIYWLKDGRRLGDTEDGIIVTQEGHLIVVSARLGDSGNFTCVAENLAGTRRSPPAEIVIYEDAGGWSSWSSWSSCPSSCARALDPPVRRRSRVCEGSPGLSTCPGPPSQRRVCPCPESPVWSPWSPWSLCTADCSRERVRLCESSVSCPGVSTSSIPCHGDLCPRDWIEPSSPSPSPSSTDLALYVGLSIAVLLFLLVLLSVLGIIRRRRLPGGFSLTEQCRSQSLAKKGVLASYGPDLTQGGVTGTELASVCYEYSYPDTNSNTSYSKGRREEEHHYEQPMVRLPSRSPVDSLAKPLISSSSSSSTGGNISPRSAGTLDTSLLPTSPFTRWSSVTSSGARICLPDTGICLTVPEAALSSPQDLCLASIHDTKSFPSLLPSQTLLSPVVYIGNSSTSKRSPVLTKPAVISLPHCASLRQGGWTVSVAWRPTGDCQWTTIVTLGQERVDTPVYVQLDLATVHLVTENFGTYCLLGSPTPGNTNPPLKSLRIAAFAQEVSQGADITVRLYCVQDCEAAQTYVEWTEKQFGGRLLDRAVSCLLQYSTIPSPLGLRLDRLGEGWAVQAGAELQQVPFSHLWTNHNPSLHCSFTLRHTSPHLRTLALSVSISQEGNNNRCGLKVTTTLAQERVLRPSSSGCSSTDSGQSTAVSPWRLPAQTKETLARMLDAPVSIGNDWRMLAERLNVHRYTAYFATKPSPTGALLVLWEARNREAAATQGLLGILRGMGRFDAAHLLEHDLQMV